jgi:predicted acyl esterase
MKEITFKGSNDPHTPISLGWLRASHRKLDEVLSKPYMPYHTHDEYQPLAPGEVYDLNIEILPTSIVIPKGYRLALSVRGKDYETAAAQIPYGINQFSGVGPHRHANGIDRKKEIFHNKVTLYFGGATSPFLLLPIIPYRAI